MRLYPEMKFLYVEWQGVISSEELRSVFIKNCALVIEHGVEVAVADFSRLSIPLLADQLWIANHAKEQLKCSKLTRIANIMAPELLQQLSIDTLNGSSSDGLPPCVTRDFMLEEDALSWLFPEGFC